MYKDNDVIHLVVQIFNVFLLLTYKWLNKVGSWLSSSMYRHLIDTMKFSAVRIRPLQAFPTAILNPLHVLSIYINVVLL